MGAGWSPDPIEPEGGGLRLYLALPWRSYRFYTHLTPEQCAQALRPIVEARRWLRIPWKRGKSVFEGEVTHHDFSLRRIIIRRNPYQPEIFGSFEADGNGSRVRLAIRLNWIALVCWIALILACLAAAAYFVVTDTGSRRNHALIYCGIALLVLYLVVGFRFGIEAEKARRLLVEALTERRRESFN